MVVPPVAIAVPTPVETVTEVVTEVTPVVETVTEVTQTETPVVETTPAPVSDVSASHTREYLEANGCNVEKALESLGDMETYDIAAEEFVAEYETNMGKIKTAKEAGDMANYAIETHGLKSNARYMGFEELGEMSYQHELAGKESNTEFVNSNYDALMAEAERVYNIAKKYMES